MVALDSLPRLVDEELEVCRRAFLMFDKDGSGTIDVKELKQALAALGTDPTDEEVFVMISQVDEDGSNEIDFQEFVHAIQINKAMSERSSDESETLDAFVALGGNPDKTGAVLTQKLHQIVKDFELTLDVEKFMQENDNDNSGTLGYEEFKMLLQ